MQVKWRPFLICIAIPLIVGGIAGSISKDSMSMFAALNKPPLAPPGWVFPVVWTLLYVMMGIASYLVISKGTEKRLIIRSMFLYTAQLLINFLWTFWFFNRGMYLFAFFWLLILWVLIVALIVFYARSTKAGAMLMVPYLLWVTFAGYLNLGIVFVN